MAQKDLGYPPQYLKSWKRHQIKVIRIFTLAGAATAFIIFRAIFGRDDLLLATLVAATFFVALWINWPFRGPDDGMVFYFERNVPGPFIFSLQMAQNCIFLDQIAVDAGVEPLSSFLSEDDFCG